MKPIFATGIAFFSIATYFAVAMPKSAPPAAEDTTPSRVLLTWGGDPATTAVVTWRTEAVSGGAELQYAAASADPRFVSNTSSAKAVSQTVELAEGGSAYYHTASLTGLKPDTRYSYRVGDGAKWSEWFDFKTASSQPKPFTFVYFGDAQNDIKSMWSRVVRQSAKDAPYADFMLHAGDLINVAEADHEWAEWFYAGGWLHATVPSIATPGNHEYKNGLSKLWRPQFRYPHNGVAGLEDTNYYFDYQGARIISLNSNEKTAEQAAWLDKTLGATKANWVIVTFHHPMYSTANGRDNKALREQWLPILLKHKVDLVLQGHDHSYGRMNLPSGVSTKKGTTYLVVSVSGPKQYNLGDDAKDRMTKIGEYKQLYQVIRVAPDAIKYEARLATGELYDSFEIKK